MNMKIWGICLIVGVVGLYAYKRSVATPRFEIIGELPPLVERVPEHLKEKARQATLKKSQHPIRRIK
jgi:hypothetical protein